MPEVRGFYNHFNSIYSGTADNILCVDEQLNIVYATESAHEVFGLTANRRAHLNGVFGRGQLTKVQKAIQQAKYLSFRFEQVDTHNHAKCTLIPYLIGEKHFGILLFSDVSSEKIDTLQKFDLKYSIRSMKDVVSAATDAILTHTTMIEENRALPESTKTIKKNSMIVRKAYRNIELLSSPKITGKFKGYVEINEYLRYIADIIEQQLGDDRVSYVFEFCGEQLVAEIDPKVFEILICNIISNALKNTFGKSRIMIRTASQADQVVIIVSDSGIGCAHMHKLFNDPVDYTTYKSSEYMGTGVTLIRRIVEDHSGTIYASKNMDGGLSVAFSLPKAKRYTNELHAPIQLQMEEGFCPNILLEIAELIDAKKLNI